jgi:UDP-2,3-diacylglucosamine pyrophosphatase LpxH
MNKYVITNDWHIGSEVCQRDKIIHFLKNLQTEVLILNGDIIDINHTKRLKKKDWEILSLLRKLSKNTRIIYIRGNHDHEVAELISELLGLEFKNEFDFVINGRKYHVTHGDFFDTFISNFPIITEIATGLYYWIQRISPKKQALARALKRQSKGFIKCCDKIKKHAEHYAEVNHYDYVICGHSHLSYFHTDSCYINTGCFTEVECSYLEIDENGIPKLIKIT